MFDRIKTVSKSFSSALRNDLHSSTNDTPRTSVSNQTITSDIVKFINTLSRFGDMRDDEVYEQLYVWEPDIGSAVDRMSSLAGMSYSGVAVDKGDSLDELESGMLRDAKIISDEIKPDALTEAWAEMLMIHGNMYGVKQDDRIIIQPNRYVTKLPSPSDVGTIDGSVLISDGSTLVMYEDQGNMPTKTYNHDEYFHIRYKDTYIYQTDNMGRKTFGLYSISPIHRSILPVWWKRQTMMIDVMWRWRNVPREHHKLSSEMFTLDRFSGSKDEKMFAATTAATEAVNSYVRNLKNQEPDQGYVTLDTTEISGVSSSSGYMQVNELMGQLDRKTWAAINVPESIINGEGAGSYASELMVSNYVVGKAIELSKKFEPILLWIFKQKLLAINPEYPVEKLKLKYELEISTNLIENYRQAAIMATLDSFTDTEVREKLGYDPLTDEQREKIIKTGQEKTTGQVKRDALAGGSNPATATTPHSGESQVRDPGQQVIKE